MHAISAFSSMANFKKSVVALLCFCKLACSTLNFKLFDFGILRTWAERGGSFLCHLFCLLFFGADFSGSSVLVSVDLHLVEVVFFQEVFASP